MIETIRVVYNSLRLDRHAARMRRRNLGKVPGRSCDIGVPHWSAIAIAREHRREQGAQWVCDCPACEAIRCPRGMEALR
jgi:hypothetical protein